MSKLLFSKVLLIGVVIIFWSCNSKSVKQVIEENSPAFAAMRGKLKNISSMLENNPEVNDIACSAKLIIDKNDPNMNTDFIMYEYLADPDYQLKTDTTNDGIDLNLSNYILIALQWTGPKNPLSESVINDSGENIEKELKKGLSLQYLIVNKKAGLEKERGIYKMNHYIIDLTKESIISSFSTTTQVDPNLSVKYTVLVDQSTGKEVAGSFEGHDMFRNAVYTGTRKAFADKLKEKIGVVLQ